MFICRAESVPDKGASTGRRMTSSGTETVVEDPLCCDVMRRPQASVVRYAPGRLLHAAEPWGSPHPSLSSSWEWTDEAAVKLESLWITR